jgi:predicted RecB family nuclease
MERMKAKPLAVEQRLYAKGDFPFTGQPDLIAEIAGLRYLVDIKPTFRKWHKLQLAGYAALLQLNKQPVYRQMILPLDSSKRPMAVSCGEPQDGSEWDRCVKSWYWRYRNGLLKVEK